MNTLWTFGDSFTFGYGCRPDGPLLEYYNNYKTEQADVWPALLGKMLNLEVKNFGKCAASNDYIIDSIIDQWDKIKENDFVIIGYTWHSRFDVPLKNKFETIYIEWDIWSDMSVYEKEQIETIINFQYYFANDELYKKRHLKRFDFLHKLLKEKKTTTFIWNVEFIQNTIKFEKISDDTNGKIEDFHFSFKGNKDFADMVYKKLINPSLI